MQFAFVFAGALVATFALTRLIGWLLKKIGKNRLGLSHFIAAVMAVGLAAVGNADGGPPQFVYAFIIYVPAVLIWFIFDLWRLRRSADADQRATD